MATLNEINLATCCKTLTVLCKKFAKDNDKVTQKELDLLDDLQDLMVNICNEPVSTKRAQSVSNSSETKSTVIYRGLEKGDSWYGIKTDEERLEKSGGVCDFAVVEDGKVIFAVYLDYTLKTLLQPIFINGKHVGFCSVGKSNKDKQYFTPEYLRNYILKEGAALEKGLPNPNKINPRLKVRFQDQYYDPSNIDEDAVQRKYKLVARPAGTREIILWDSFSNVIKKDEPQPEVEAQPEVETDDSEVVEVAE
jgi:hypothetical protein